MASVGDFDQPGEMYLHTEIQGPQRPSISFCDDHQKKSSRSSSIRGFDVKVSRGSAPETTLQRDIRGTAFNFPRHTTSIAGNEQ